uniref:uncharacterized protein LOC122601489 n=1 Tax=Erigeron canadensis TaxID=72917 RepID=UPI001CB91C89|nr:uncharacterized protein LOC122601489 [Erigeron canadensis]
MNLEAHNIKRRENESIRQFITRYTDETALMKGLSENQKISGFDHGLRFQPLVEFLFYGPTTRDKKQWAESQGQATTKTLTEIEETGTLDTKGSERSIQQATRKSLRKPLYFPASPKKCPGYFSNREGSDKGNQGQDKRHGKNPIIEAPEAKAEPLEEIMATVFPECQITERQMIITEAWKKVAISLPPIKDKEACEAPIIIRAIVGSHPVKRIHLDTRSGCEIMYEHCFLKLKATLRKKRKDNISPLVGFLNERTWSLGEVTLNVTVGEVPRTRSEMLTFVIVRAESPYNIILGRPAMRKLGMVPSPIHAIVKFPTPRGIGFVKTEPRPEVQCSHIRASESGECSKKNGNLEAETEKLFIDNKYPDQHVMIGRQLPTEYNRKLKEVLEKNKDVFPWTPADMTGVPRELKINGEIFDTQHRLNARKHLEPIKQKCWSLVPDRNKAAKEQVEDLVKIGILREVKYQSWVANPVMVKKHDGGWRICVDFTDINKACPKDVIRSQKLIGRLNPSWASDMSKMPFGLKNARATYQRLVDKAFGGQIGRNLEAYVDDMVIKSINEEDMFLDIEETFKTLRSINMKLNPKKCSFGVEEGQFLGHALKEVQSLNGKLAALHRFLSKSADRSLPFFHTLKGCLEKQNFRWTEEAQQAFAELKDYLCQLPTMTAPTPGETLQMYIAPSGETISAILIANKKGVQQPIYYVSRVLQAPETRRLAKWAVELGEHEIEFKPRSAIKGQILADFLAEVPLMESKNKRKAVEETKAQNPEEKSNPGAWKLFTDGASSSDDSSADLILTNPDGQEFTYALRFDFKASNNAAEYEALLAGLRIAKQMKVEHIHAYIDSQIVAFQVYGTYEAKEPSMKKYLEKVRQIRQSFRIHNVSRSRNKIAYALSKLTSTSFAHLTKEVLVEILQKSSIDEEIIVAPVEEEGKTWMTPIIEYLTSELLPPSKDEARKIRIKAPQYTLRDEGLYRKSYLGPLLRCVGPNQAKAVIQEVHQGCCGAYAGPRTVVAKITKMGYYWPSMHNDTLKEIQSYDSCQIHAVVPKAPKSKLIPVTVAWPFSKWGIDIAGPFLQAPGRVKFLVVAVDYFTKWVEAKPLATISGKQIEKFAWEQIVTRFGIPQVIVSDNGKQFSHGIFPQFCNNLEIQQRFTSAAHPRQTDMSKP